MESQRRLTFTQKKLNGKRKTENKMEKTVIIINGNKVINYGGNGALYG